MYNVKMQMLNMDKLKLNNTFNELLTNKSISLFKLKNSYIITNPKLLYEKYIAEINNNINKLELLNPLNALKRGYGIVKKDNKCIENITNIEINDKISISLKDGNINAKVTDKEEV